MSAAVSAMQHQPSTISRPNSRMGTNSPIENKRTLTIKAEESARNPPKSSNLNNTTNRSDFSEKGSSNSSQETKPNGTNGDNASRRKEGSSPPPPPGPGAGSGDDYFSMNPRNSRLDQEPNPFEQSFAGGGSSNGNNNPLDTPNKTVLPPVTAINSPAPLMGGSNGFSWDVRQSLRSGPLSPAMLTGPTNQSGGLGFDHIRTGLTPNESGIRSGLTPGGPMFPAPSPGFYGGTTPGAMEFQKTALSAARRSSHPAPPPLAPPPTTQESKPEMIHPPPTLDPMANQHKPRQDSYADPAHNAASGLFLLANQQPQYSQQQHHHPPGIQANGPSTLGGSPDLSRRGPAIANGPSATAPGSKFSGAPANDARGISEMSNDRSGSSMEPEQSTRRGKSTKAKAAPASTGKRKNEESAANGAKSTPNKKRNRAMSATTDEGEDYGEDGDNQDTERKDGRKMTDEEKRKNFLERNRVAALKCRQRKKQWLANLQAKVELFGTENDHLNATVQQLREEIVSLKTLLLAHKDCPVARANGVQIDLANMPGGGDPGYNAHMMMQNAYNPMMAQAGVMQQGPPPGVDRRFS